MPRAGARLAKAPGRARSAWQALTDIEGHAFVTSNGEGGRTVWHRQDLGRRVLKWQQTTRRTRGDRGRGRRGKWSGQSRNVRRKKIGKRASVYLPLAYKYVDKYHSTGRAEKTKDKDGTASDSRTAS